MSGVGRQDGGDGSAEPSRRRDGPYVAPPHIRTTGEVPAVTGEVPTPPAPSVGPLRRSRPVPPGETADPWSLGGSVVDRPAPSPPDWMSGVQVPELLVTRDLDPAELARAGANRLADTVQRVVGLILVAVLVAIVALVLASSVLGF